MGYISTLNEGDTGSMTFSDAVEGSGAGVEGDQFSGLDSSTGDGRIRGSVPEPLVNRLGPLATETATAAPITPSSNVRERG